MERYGLFTERQELVLIVLAVLMGLFIVVRHYAGAYQPLPEPPQEEGRTVIFLVP